jgi:hypothetical protein
MASHPFYLRSGMLGVAVGAIVMAGLLSLPMTNPPGATAIVTTGPNGQRLERFHIKADDILAVSHDGRDTTPLYPADIRPLPDFGSPGNAVITAKLRNSNGEVVGVASRYTAVVQDPATPEAWWTLVLTRRGTIASHCIAPSHSQCGQVIGGTDEFAAFQGRLDEAFENGGYTLTLSTAGDGA